MSRRIVVTGADGFAGRWLCRQQRSQGAEVLGWVHHLPADPLPGVIYRVQPLEDGPGVRSALRADRPERLFHLGAVSRVGACDRDPDRAIAVNVGGTEHLLSALPGSCRMLLASTCLVYGQPEWLPLDEAHPTCPDSLYGRTKETAERLCLAAVRSGLRVVVARAFHHTGPGQAARYALADWAGQLAAGRGGEEAPVRTGDLALRRDYSDVRDIVAGYSLLLERAEAGAVVQLCSGSAPSMGELLTLMNGGVPPATTTMVERLDPSEPRELRGNPAVAQALGWRCTHRLSETLAALRADAGPEPGGTVSPSGRP